MPRELTHIDLFSGIGGFALAAKWAGIKTVQFVEIDKFCQQVLNKIFPGVPIHDDIKTFTNARCERQKKRKEQAEGIEQLNQKPFLITGGFPCQPFSCAGKRKGTEDDRHLWPEMLRVIKEFKPTWIIGENVAGIRSMELCNSESAMEGHSDIQEDGENDYTTVMDGICNDLEAIGYEVQPIIIPACAVGAPHRRDRIFFIANARHNSGRRSIKRDARTPCEQQTEATIGDAPFITVTRPNPTQGVIAHDNGSGNGTSASRTDGNRKKKDKRQKELTQFEYSRQGSHVADTGYSTTTRQRQYRRKILPEQETGRYCKSPAWSEHWLTVATRLCRMDDGLSEELYKLETSDRVARLRALGNAIVPQIAYEIMLSILEVSE